MGTDISSTQRGKKVSSMIDVSVCPVAAAMFLQIASYVLFAT